MMILVLQGEFAKSFDFDERARVLDEQITTLRSLGYEIGVVTAGDVADELLRRSKRLPSTELVFDTYDRESSLWTQLYAGLCLTQRQALVTTLQRPTPELNELFHLVQTGWCHAGKEHLLVHPAGGALFVTSSGRQFFVDNEDPRTPPEDLKITTNWSRNLTDGVMPNEDLDRGGFTKES